MEKCTYCVQRIAGARQEAEREGRPLRAGEVVTACQSACPTRAIRFGELSVVPGEHASMGGRRLPLSRAEFALLEFLAMRAGRAVGRGTLMAALYGGADEPEPKAIDVRLCKLRQTLAAHGAPAGLIGTVWGVGWIMPTPFAPGTPMPSHRAEVKRILRECAA